ncbi:hypothetical protein JNW87_29030, partial [Micromonospora sp. ATA51]|nr:hypothetical protein [Micromonospora sp. ATA51]
GRPARRAARAARLGGVGAASRCAARRRRCPARRSARHGEPERVAGLVDALRAATAAVAGHAVVLTAPPTVRDRVDLWGPVDGLALMRRVKQRFDPDARLAPGRFVGGI